MITVVTDNLDEHTIFVSYSFYVGEGLFDQRKIMNRMYCTKNLKNLLFDIKLIAISTKKSPFPYSGSRGNTYTLLYGHTHPYPIVYGHILAFLCMDTHPHFSSVCTHTHPILLCMDTS